MQFRSIWAVSPQPPDRRRFTWDRGAFDVGRRAYTEVVEGSICSPQHLLMVTLRGGARRHRIKTACGHHYDGPDRAGCASFLPADCERRLRLEGVAWEWASIALRPDLLSESMDPSAGLDRVNAFSNAEDPFLVGLLSELERVHATDGRLDLTYCDAMSVALALYLGRRYGSSGRGIQAVKLQPWRLNKLTDYIEAHLDEEIRISTLASLVGLSEGHLHRALRLTTGRTPLQFINERRVYRAMDILSKEAEPISVVALRVGFASPSHFARVFRAVTGVGPSQYRRDLDGASRPARLSSAYD